MDVYKRNPHSGKDPSSLVIFLHGLGANGQDLIGIAQYWAEAIADTMFISPDAPEPCDMAPPEMTSSRQWFSMQDRQPEKIEQGVKRASAYLNAYIDQQCEEYKIPAEKIALVGFSQGAMMSFFVGLQRKDPLACILGYSGAFVGGGDLTPETVTKTPVFLRHGDDDMVVPVDAFHQTKQRLTDLGLDVEGNTVPGLGHGIDDDGIDAGRTFLKAHLG